MPDGGGIALHTLEIKGNSAQVVQRELQGAGTLLFRNFSSYRAVHLVGEPVFAGHSLQLHYTLQVLDQLGRVCFNFMIGGMQTLVLHNGPGWFPEHVGQLQVHGFLTRFFTFKCEPVVHGNLANNVYGCPFPPGDPHQFVHIFSLHYQSHAFLGFISNDLLCREGGVTHGQFV